MMNSEYKKRVSKIELKEYSVKRFEGKVHVLETEEGVQEAVDYLSQFKFLGFDTESKPTFVKGKTNINGIALLQLSSGDVAYLFRLNKFDMTESLKKLLENPNILKIGSATHGDIPKIAELYKKGDFHPKGFVDIQIVGKKHNIETVGLAKLTAILLDFRISKRQQLSNWETDKLSDAQVNYAATDAWACYKLYENFIKRGMV